MHEYYVSNSLTDAITSIILSTVCIVHFFSLLFGAYSDA